MARWQFLIKCSAIIMVITVIGYLVNSNQQLNKMNKKLVIENKKLINTQLLLMIPDKHLNQFEQWLINENKNITSLVSIFKKMNQDNRHNSDNEKKTIQATLNNKQKINHHTDDDKSIIDHIKKKPESNDLVNNKDGINIINLSHGGVLITTRDDVIKDGE